MFYRSLSFAGLLVGAALPAGAASVSIGVDAFTLDQTAEAQSAYEAHVAGAAWRKAEDFESMPSWNGVDGTDNAVVTKAGTIKGVSEEPGSGHTAINGGAGLEVRDTKLKGMADFTPVWGRQNLSEGGKNWLDSNDLTKMVWTIGADTKLGKFDRLSYFLTDVGDIAGTDFSVTVSGKGIQTATQHITAQANGEVNLVRILLDDFVTEATVTMTSQRNDGFGIDDLTIAQVAPIPLPLPGLLLMAGLGGLAFVARGRKAA